MSFLLTSLLLYFSPLLFSPMDAFADTAKRDHFIDQLMAKMSLEEKAGQLAQYTAEMSVTGSSINENYRDEIVKGHVGSIFNAYTPQFTRRLQQIAVEQSRLKIPLLFAYDVIHGHHTIFPIPLGESSTWDLAWMERSARIAAAEAAADGLHWTFAPMVDIGRDPRWGRISEGAGEDPFLGSRIAEAKVRGFQGDHMGESLDSIMACVKHYAAYGAVTAGRDYNSVDINDRELFETYLPPYQAAVRAGVASLMPAFNDIAGVPSTGNEFLLKKVLRERWKFPGIVVSDYTAINEMVPHGVVPDEKHAAQLAMRATVDMDMQGGLYIKYLPALVREGKIAGHALDKAVRRILEMKYKFGLFKDPYRFSDEKRAQKVILSRENLAASREVARRSIVLLRNEAAVLPLKKSGSLALIGPFADDHRNLIGNWSAAGDWRTTVSLRQGLANVVGDKVKINYALGANILDAGKLIDTLNKSHADLTLDPRPDEKLIAEAVAVAKKSDVVVVALGEAQSMSGEAASRTRIRLPENQQALLQALHEKSGKPIILLLSNGRPLVLEAETHLADAIVETWFLGSESGNAIADVLFGDYNPSGRLTMSFPYSEGQIPIFYSARSTGRPFDPEIKYTTKYLDAPNEPLFPFGFGLSYTKFVYSNLKLSSDVLRAGDKMKVEVTVKNAGATAGEETVQLYIRDMVASVTRPMKQLRGFSKVFLKAGESRKVNFTLDIEDLKFYDQEMHWTAEPSAVKVMVGGNSHDLIEAGFEFTGQKVVSK